MTKDVVLFWSEHPEGHQNLLCTPLRRDDKHPPPPSQTTTSSRIVVQTDLIFNYLSEVTEQKVSLRAIMSEVLSLTESKYKGNNESVKSVTKS